MQLNLMKSDAGTSDPAACGLQTGFDSRSLISQAHSRGSTGIEVSRAVFSATVLCFSPQVTRKNKTSCLQRNSSYFTFEATQTKQQRIPLPHEEKSTVTSWKSRAAKAVLRWLSWFARWKTATGCWTTFACVSGTSGPSLQMDISTHALSLG